jgi:hypothetical protein
MAKEATRPEDRAQYQHQERLWLQIADQAEASQKAEAVSIEAIPLVE